MLKSELQLAKPKFLNSRSKPLSPYTPISLAIAVLLYAGSAVARIGTNDLPSVMPLILSATIILMPETLQSRFNLSLPLLQMAMLLIFFTLGWISILLEVDLTIVLISSFLLSLYCFVAKKKIRQEIGWRWVAKWLGVGCLALMLMAQLWTQSYLNPLAPEAYVVGGDFLHIDTFFSTAITSMIKGHGVASTGLFGLVPLTYHSGSNFLFAAFIRLCKVDVLQFYNVGYPVIFVPLFCQGILSASTVGTQGNPRAGTVAIKVVALFFVLCELLGGQIGSLFFLPTTLNSHLNSHSYCVSLIFMISAITIYYPFFFQGRLLHTDKVVQAILLLAIPVWIFIIGYTKISTGVILFAGFTYVVFRTNLLIKKWTLISWITSSAAIFCCYLLTAETNENTFMVQFGSFYKMYIKGNLLVFFLLNYGFLILFVIATIWINSKLKTTFYENLRSGKFLAVEAIVVAAVVGVLPGLLIHIQGGSAIYFSEIQYWLSSIAVIGVAPWFVYRMYRYGRRAVKYATGAVVVVVFIATFTAIYSFWRRNFQIRTALVYGKDVRFSQFMKTVSWHALIDTLGINLGASGDYKKQLSPLNLTLFRQLRELPIEVKSTSILYCEDLKELETFLRCHEATFYAPAMSEMPLINGLYWKSCFPDMRYGMQVYQNMPDQLSKQEAFQLAKQKGFQHVVILSLTRGSYELIKL